MDLSENEILSCLQNMDEYEFENLIADLWQTRGWETTVTTSSNDSGVDVIAEKDKPFYQKQLIQAKRYASGNKIGSPDIQQYSSLRQQMDHVDAVVVVTTSDFSSQAQDTADNLNVKLIDGENLVSLLVGTDSEDILEEYLDIFEYLIDRYREDPYNYEDGVEKLQKLVRYSPDDSITESIVGDIIIRGERSGYSISHGSLIDEDINAGCIHQITNDSGQIREFGKTDWVNMKTIANRRGMEIVSNDENHGGRIMIGESNGEDLDKENVIKTMDQVLSYIFKGKIKGIKIKIS